MKILILFSFFLINSFAYASEFSGQITNVHVRSDGLIYVDLTGTRNSKPPCAVYDYMMLKGEDSPVGTKMYSALLTAFLTNRNVKIVGSKSCSRWGDGEDIGEVILTP